MDRAPGGTAPVSRTREGAWAASPSADSGRYSNRGRTTSPSNCRVTRSRNAGASATMRRSRSARLTLVDSADVAGNLQRRQQRVRIDDHVHGAGAVSNDGRRLRLADLVRTRRPGARDQDCRHLRRRRRDAGDDGGATFGAPCRFRDDAGPARGRRDIQSALSYVAPVTADWKPTLRPG